MAKKPYRVCNWKDYNENLVQKGSITFWLDEKVIKSWYARDEQSSGGRPLLYSHITIECALILRTLFHLALCANVTQPKQFNNFIQQLVKARSLPELVWDFIWLSSLLKKFMGRS